MNSRVRFASPARLLVLAVLAALVLAATAGWWDRAPDLRGPGPLPPPAAEAVARGAYLARVGHCAGCHSARGGADYGGGRVIATPFGSVVAANLSPDPAAGIGRWTPAAFRRALAEGRSADGRALLPAWPYPNFALVTPGDADDLFAYLRSLPPVKQAVPPHDLHGVSAWPVALTAWRVLHAAPGPTPAAPAGVRADWARGAYLVGGLGHCGACHGLRNAWGAVAGAWDLRGGELPLQGWIAPSLLDPAQAGVAGWTEDEVVDLLRGAAGARRAPPCRARWPWWWHTARSTGPRPTHAPPPSSCATCQRRPSRRQRRRRSRPRRSSHWARSCTSATAPTATARPAKATAMTARRWPATARWRCRGPPT
jgi:mono/diheme cytochrome c family protein